MTVRVEGSAIDALLDESSSNGGGDSETVIDLIDAARNGDATTSSAPTIEQADLPHVTAVPKKRMRKDELEQELDRMRSELGTLKARSNTDAVDSLSATIAMGVGVLGSMMASSRGSHWVFADSETKPIGDAWAVVVAPYADKLGKYLPLAIALGVSWKALKPRLDTDKANADATLVKSDTPAG